MRDEAKMSKPSPPFPWWGDASQDARGGGGEIAIPKRQREG